jgi:hypothetical protein
MLLESASDDRAGARNHLERMADAEAEVQRRTEIDARSRSARLSLLEIAEEVGVPVADQAVSFSSLLHRVDEAVLSRAEENGK